MRIIEIYMKHFGCFEEKRIKFNAGMNIIYGENETGKSTIHAFIRAMLYGFPRRSARRMDEYQLRQPWDNPSFFSGTMVFAKGDRYYRIERNFNKNANEAHLIDLEEGRELNIAPEDIGVFACGMRENVFVNTVCIAQASAGTNAELADELRNYLLNVQESGSGNMNVSAALEFLRKKKKNAEAEQKQSRDRLDGEISSLQMEQKYLREEIRKLEEDDGETDGTWDPDSGWNPETEDRHKNLTFEKLETNSQKDSQRSGPEDGKCSPEGKRDRKRENRRCRFFLVLLLFFSALCFSCVTLPETRAVRITLAMAGIACLGGAFLLIRRRIDMEPDDRADMEPAEEGTSAADKAGADRARENMEAVSAETVRRMYLQDKKRILEEKEDQLEALYGKSERLSDYAKECDALDLAMMRITEISRQISREQGRTFWTSASRTLGALTGGRYTALSIDDSREIRINTEDRLLYLAQVSCGTMNQIWLALRLEAAKVLTEEEVPVLLDETFAMYDDKRLASALRYLKQTGRQTILFTCQTREKQIWDEQLFG